MLSARFTVLLAGALLVPFALRLWIEVEPYPAILLPDGATVLQREGGVTTFESLALFARRASGEETRLDARSFMDPIPSQYLMGLAAMQFGQRQVGQRAFRFGDLTEWRVDAKRATAAERAAALAWVAGRVLAADPQATALVVRSEGYRVDWGTGEWQEPEVKGEFELPVR